MGTAMEALPKLRALTAAAAGQRVVLSRQRVLAAAVRAPSPVLGEPLTADGATA